MILIFIISHILLYKTHWGLRLRAVGENPQAADTSGVNVYQYKYFYIILGCMVASLGGVFLSIGHLNFFAWGMTSGRGFIALAAMILGKWTPFGCLAASFLWHNRCFTDETSGSRYSSLTDYPSLTVCNHHSGFSWFRWTFHRSVQLQTLYKTIVHLSVPFHQM